MAAGDDVFDGVLALDQAFEDIIQFIIGRQAVLVELVRLQFR
jgi:hypothetical protein